MWLDQMIFRIFRVLVTVLLANTLIACGTVSSWLEDDVYVAPPAELVEFTNEFEPQVLWNVDTGAGAADDYSDLAAWIQGEMIVTVDSEGNVRSYNNQSGKNLWKAELDKTVAAGAGGGEGHIFVGTVEGTLFALDENNGQVKWQQKLTSEVLSPPKATRGIVVVRTADGRMTGLAVEDGKVLWNYQRSVPLLSLRGASSPVLVDDKVIAGYANGKLVELAINDGSVLWEKSVAVPRGRTELDRLVDIDADPVILNGIVYVVTYHGKLAALRVDTGDVVWARDMSSRTGLDVDQYNAVYVTDDEDSVWAIQDGSGDGLWRQTRLVRRKVTAPAIVGGNLIVGDLEGYVHWISREDGRFVSRLKVADTAIQSKPLVHDGIVYITANDGSLTALRVQ
jgi:outer membrane protein assembly factor BamB